jgi:hypothetical protein
LMHTNPFSATLNWYFLSWGWQHVPSSLGSRRVGVMRVQLIMPQLKTTEIGDFKVCRVQASQASSPLQGWQIVVGHAFTYVFITKWYVFTFQDII